MSSDCIVQLLEALQHGNLAIFLGADLPRAITGLPARADLATGLAHRHRLDASGSLAAVAQQVSRHGQRYQIVSYLHDQLDTTGKSPQLFHRRVVKIVQRFDVALLVTTAYDDLLKRAFEAESMAIDVVMRSSGITFANPRTPTLIKLYGDLQQPDTLVVTEDDHYGLWRDRDKEDLLDEVRATMRRNAILFLGYNLADPDFNLLWREVLDRAGQFAIGAYAAWPGATEAQKQVWADRQVRVLDLSALDLLGALLGKRQGETADQTQTDSTAVFPQPEAPSGDAGPDRLAAIRELLRAGFTAQTLPHFCEDRPTFRPIVDEFGPGHGLNDMIDEVITYCRKHLLLDEMLAEVEQVNPQQYARFKGRLGHHTPSRPPAEPQTGEAGVDAGGTASLGLRPEGPQAANAAPGRSGTITWLHLSDLHFRLPPAHSGDLPPYDANVVLRALLDDIAERIQHDGLQPDFIAVTGDVAFSGKQKEYDLARRFFDDLLQTTGLDQDRLFLVPGNHDVDRSKISRGARGIAASLTDRASANEVLANPADRALIFARFEGYQAFIDSYLAGHLSSGDYASDEGYFYVEALDIAGRRIALLGLNSAWLAHGGDEDRGQLVLGERQVRAALEQGQEAALKIALLHHPFAWLREFECSDSEAMLTDRCDFILHGHMHQVGLLQARGPDSNAFIIAAGACYESRKHPNAYNFVQLDLAAGRGAVHLRTYSDQRGGFWTKDVMNYRNVPDGVYEFQLSIPTRDVAARPPKSQQSRTQHQASPASPSPPVQGTTPLGPGQAQRCVDLAENIRETLDLIRQYEEQRRLTDDPKAKRRAERQIADLRTQLAGYRAEASQVGCEEV